MTDIDFDPQNPVTWIRIADHPVFQGRVSEASEWSLDPGIYEGAVFSSFNPEWYSHRAEPIAAAEGEANAKRELQCLREIAMALIGGDSGWKVELFFWEAYSMSLLARKPLIADSFIYLSEDGLLLFAAIDTDDEREYRVLPPTDVVRVLEYYATGGSLDKFADLEV